MGVSLSKREHSMENIQVLYKQAQDLLEKIRKEGDLDNIGMIQNYIEESKQLKVMHGKRNYLIKFYFTLLTYDFSTFIERVDYDKEKKEELEQIGRSAYDVQCFIRDNIDYPLMILNDLKDASQEELFKLFEFKNKKVARLILSPQKCEEATLIPWSSSKEEGNKEFEEEFYAPAINAQQWSQAKRNSSDSKNHSDPSLSTELEVSEDDIIDCLTLVEKNKFNELHIDYLRKQFKEFYSQYIEEKFIALYPCPTKVKFQKFYMEFYKEKELREEELQEFHTEEESQKKRPQEFYTKDDWKLLEKWLGFDEAQLQL